MTILFVGLCKQHHKQNCDSNMTGLWRRLGNLRYHNTCWQRLEYWHIGIQWIDSQTRLPKKRTALFVAGDACASLMGQCIYCWAGSAQNRHLIFWVMCAQIPVAWALKCGKAWRARSQGGAPRVLCVGGHLALAHAYRWDGFGKLSLSVFLSPSHTGRGVGGVLCIPAVVPLKAGIPLLQSILHKVHFGGEPPEMFALLRNTFYKRYHIKTYSNIRTE